MVDIKGMMKSFEHRSTRYIDEKVANAKDYSEIEKFISDYEEIYNIPAEIIDNIYYKIHNRSLYSLENNTKTATKYIPDLTELGEASSNFDVSSEFSNYSFEKMQSIFNKVELNQPAVTFSVDDDTQEENMKKYCLEVENKNMNIIVQEVLSMDENYKIFNEVFQAVTTSNLLNYGYFYRLYFDLLLFISRKPVCILYDERIKNQIHSIKANNIMWQRLFKTKTQVEDLRCALEKETKKATDKIEIAAKETEKRLESNLNKEAKTILAQMYILLGIFIAIPFALFSIVNVSTAIFTSKFLGIHPIYALLLIVPIVIIIPGCFIGLYVFIKKLVVLMHEKKDTYKDNMS